MNRDVFSTKNVFTCTLFVDRKPCRRGTSHFGNCFVLCTLSQSMSSLAAPRWACLKEETFMVYRKTGDQVQERLSIFAAAWKYSSIWGGQAVESRCPNSELFFPIEIKVVMTKGCCIFRGRIGLCNKKIRRMCPAMRGLQQGKERRGSM